MLFFPRRRSYGVPTDLIQTEGEYGLLAEKSGDKIASVERIALTSSAQYGGRRRCKSFNEGE